MQQTPRAFKALVLGFISGFAPRGAGCAARMRRMCSGMTFSATADQKQATSSVFKARMRVLVHPRNSSLAHCLIFSCERGCVATYGREDHLVILGADAPMVMVELLFCILTCIRRGRGCVAANSGQRPGKPIVDFQARMRQWCWSKSCLAFQLVFDGERGCVAANSGQRPGNLMFWQARMRQQTETAP